MEGRRGKSGGGEADPTSGVGRAHAQAAIIPLPFLPLIPGYFPSLFSSFVI